MWRVTITSEEERIRLIQADENRLFGMFFYNRNAVLEAIDPEASGNPPPEPMLEFGEVGVFVLTRTGTQEAEVSPLDTSETGTFLESNAIKLSPPSGSSPQLDWYWIEWFGYFKLYGLSYGYHSEFGTFYFGADGFSESSNGAWIYFNELEQWVLVSPTYGFGKAYSPAADAVIDLEAALSD